jgi:HK97 family phage major capsid protein
MTLTRTTGGPLLSPEQVQSLLVVPVLAASAATQDGVTCTLVNLDGKQLRVPRVTTDVTASWVAEAAEIPVSDMALDELVVTPKKVAALSYVSVEAAEDTSPAAVGQLSASIVRDIARQLDAGFVSGNGTGANPTGLTSLATGAGNVQDLATGAATPTSLDAFARAISLSSGVGGRVTSFLANPADLLSLQLIKEGTGSNKPLLGADPSNPTRSMAFGVPFVTSPAVATGTVWALSAAHVLAVVRKDSSVEADHSVAFTSDRVAVKGTMRVNFGFPYLPALVRIRFATS